MKPSIEKVALSDQRSLVVRHLRVPYFDAPYHFHPEYELTYILRGYGQRFVGTGVEPFREGDLVLLGPNLAHFWRSDHDFYQGKAERLCEAIVIQFSSRLAEQWLVSVPEFASLGEFLASARRGLAFGPQRPAFLETTLRQLLNAPAAQQMLLFLQLLHQLRESPPARPLSEGDRYTNATENLRMARILDYTVQHFREAITLTDIAGTAHLSEAAFCRYFRQRTQKTYVTYLNELRLSHARQLLMTTDLAISQVALESGFQNLSHFHRLFRKHTGRSPLRFRALFNSP